MRLARVTPDKRQAASNRVLKKGASSENTPHMFNAHEIYAALLKDAYGEREFWMRLGAHLEENIGLWQVVGRLPLVLCILRSQFEMGHSK